MHMYMPVFQIKAGRDMETGSRGARRGAGGGFCFTRCNFVLLESFTLKVHSSIRYVI